MYLKLHLVRSKFGSNSSPAIVFTGIPGHKMSQLGPRVLSMKLPGMECGAHRLYLRRQVVIKVPCAPCAALLKLRKATTPPPAEWQLGQAGVRQGSVTVSDLRSRIRKHLHPPHTPVITSDPNSCPVSHHPHSIDEEMEVQRGQATCRGHPANKWLNQDTNPGIWTLVISSINAS